jgi:hypothetical protein
VKLREGSNTVYLILETKVPAVVGSPVFNKSGRVLGMLVATGSGEGLTLFISNVFVRDELALMGL